MGVRAAEQTWTVGRNATLTDVTVVDEHRRPGSPPSPTVEVRDDQPVEASSMPARRAAISRR